MSDYESAAEDEVPPPPTNILSEEVDSDTLRIMLSTDNHLGYCERDPIRGLDSFAAFEEVLSLARVHKCDMVLFAGDLFHDNKPTRQTIHKTMEIIRRYCMGPNPVPFQILSDQTKNFRNPVSHRANYEDEYYSVDLPIFAIHGNHDDPTRDGRTGELLAALDLLSVANLVNYFGLQNEVDKIEIGPVVMKKGDTKVALYGLGSMRDERLNRMWQNKKVRFLRPCGDDEYFNIFALHQNRDLGRGSKNCVHESMIPEWMDLVVWGHEHECLIHPTESLVGTFRITQPGSSVATSLVAGESVRKHVGVLDVRGHEFRMTALPLTQVRPFCMGEVSLRMVGELDPDDPKIDERVMEVLEEKVRDLIEEAKRKDRELKDDADKMNQELVSRFVKFKERRYKMEQPGQVLVRLKVEHTGFSTINNQRFGHRFISEIANPSDVLLFHRRRVGYEDAKKSRNTEASSSLAQPIAPEELAEVNVEDLVKDNLTSSDHKLEILQEQKMGLALEDFVGKEERSAITYTVEDILISQRKTLVERGQKEDGGMEDNKSKITTGAGVREVCIKEAEKNRAKIAQEEEEDDLKESQQQSSQMNEDDDDEQSNNGSTNRKVTNNKRKNQRYKNTNSDDESESSRSEKVSSQSTRRGGGGGGGRLNSRLKSQNDDASQTTTRRGGGGGGGRMNSRLKSQNDDDDDDDDVIEVSPPTKRQRPARQAATRTKNSIKTNRKYDELSSDDSDFPSQQSKTAATTRIRGSQKKPQSTTTVLDIEDDDDDDDYRDKGQNDEDEDDDDDIVEETQPPKSRKSKQTKLTAFSTPSSSQRTTRGGRAKATTTVVVPSTSKRRQVATNKRTATRSTAKKRSLYDDGSSDDEGDKGGRNGTQGGGGGWGTAASPSQQVKKRRGRR